MRILYIALSCSPYGGSEDAIGWNLPLAMAMAGEDVTVITRSEQKTYIDCWYREHSNVPKLQFEYVPVPRPLSAFHGRLQSLRLNPWLHCARKRAGTMVHDQDFDVIHQITPIEFRAIMVPLGHRGINVIGPIGAGGEPCKEIKSYLDKGLMESCRRVINRHCVNSLRNASKLSAYDLRYFANSETRDILTGHGAIRTDKILTDIGIAEKSIQRRDDEKHACLHVLSLGRLVPRKGINLLLDSLTKIHYSGYELRIYGDGPEKLELTKKAKTLGLKRVSFMGGIDYMNIDAAYEWADIFVFPSIRDTTGTVLLEALAHGVPIIAFRQFGAAVVLDDRCALLVNPEDGATGFAEALDRWLKNPDEIPSRHICQDCSRAYTWERKALNIRNDYIRVLSNSEWEVLE